MTNRFVHGRWLRVAKVSALALASTLTQCHKDSNTTLSVSSSAPSKAAQAPSANTPSQAPALPAEAPAAVEPGLGEWIVAAPYKFRLTRVQRCGPARAKTGQTEADGSAVRLGFVVEIQSKYDEFLAHPRDVTLQKHGVIYSSEPNGSGCDGTALAPTMLKRDQLLRGVVTFQLPTEDDARSAKIVYEPTRWGGAPRVEANVPDCLDACAPNVASAKRAHR